MSDSYRFIDCGAGRRLESFGGVICDRVAPVASWKKQCSDSIWRGAAVKFDRETKWQGEEPENWVVEFGGIKFVLEQASNGQIGVFPEQEYNWSWLSEKISTAAKTLNVLNCFAHTGGSTLAAAKAGADVTHVDAAKSVNTRAKENAVLSGLENARIRWITEDALKFMKREHKRENLYDGIILDPPAFGRMGKKIWKFEKDMPALLDVAAELFTVKPSFFLLTVHHTGWGIAELQAFIKRNKPELLKGKITSSEMEVRGKGNSLPLGICLKVEYDV